jgi:predicted DNA-binding protein
MIRGRVHQDIAVVSRHSAVNVTTWLETEKYNALVCLAKQRGLSKAGLVRNIIHEYLETHKTQEPIS